MPNSLHQVNLPKESGSQNHVLIIEDERHLAIGIKFNLEAEGYRVTIAEDGPSALQVFEDGKETVDLVVLDLMLPGMSGYDICENLRNAGHDMPILILSARTLSEDRTRGFEVGANQYMMKPFELEEFLTRVKALLSLYQQGSKRKRQTSGINEFAIGTAKINFETYEVTVAEKPIRMTQLEMKLLHYFVENEGRVIPRQELLENVWNMPGKINTRAPDQFIRRLRKVFEKNSAQPKHFLTIRDAGYRFIAEPDKQK